MDDREQREIKAKILAIKARRDRERKELQEAWEDLVWAILEAFRIPTLVRWLADKLNGISSR